MLNLSTVFVNNNDKIIAFYVYCRINNLIEYCKRKQCNDALKLLFLCTFRAN